MPGKGQRGGRSRPDLCTPSPRVPHVSPIAQRCTCVQNADIYAGHGGLGGPISCTTDIAITEMNIGGLWHGMEPFYMGGGLNAPDIEGLVCDGKENDNYHNPFTTGWEWLGPGQRMMGVRARMVDFLQKRCTDPSAPFAQRIIGECWFIDEWDQAIGALVHDEASKAINGNPPKIVGWQERTMAGSHTS